MTLCFHARFYKNTLYKNVQDENGQKVSSKIMELRRNHKVAHNKIPKTNFLNKQMV